MRWPPARNTRWWPTRRLLRAGRPDERPWRGKIRAAMTTERFDLTETRADAAPISLAETQALFADLMAAPAIILAVSGGPDSTALLVLAARWRAALEMGRRKRPKLIAVTIDHGLRPEAAREADEVKKL